eukprot:3812441-Rhodomonas_salina.1
MSTCLQELAGFLQYLIAKTVFLLDILVDAESQRNELNMPAMAHLVVTERRSSGCLRESKFRASLPSRLLFHCFSCAHDLEDWQKWGRYTPRKFRRARTFKFRVDSTSSSASTLASLEAGPGGDKQIDLAVHVTLTVLAGSTTATFGSNTCGALYRARKACTKFGSSCYRRYELNLQTQLERKRTNQEETSNSSILELSSGVAGPRTGAFVCSSRAHKAPLR